MIAFTEIELYRQWVADFFGDEDPEGIETPPPEMVDDLIAADSDAKIREFTAEWFPFMDPVKNWNKRPKLEDEADAVSDTRNLMLLVLELKRMVDEDDCNRESFESIGTRFSRGGTERREQAILYYLITSDYFAWHMREEFRCEEQERDFVAFEYKHDTTREDLIEEGYMDEEGNVYNPFAVVSYAPGWMVKERQLYLENQSELVKQIDPKRRYPVMYFFGGNLLKSASCSSERAYFFIDSMFKLFLNGVAMHTKNGVLTPQAMSNFASLWVCLSDCFRDSRVGMCKACGLPIVISKERGTKRLYCNDSCKRKYKRALRFARSINELGMDEQEAVKDAGIAASTAKRILALNNIQITPAK